ncbi:heat shock protein transcriptional repressor HspR [Brevibacterium litoralis]|uniref:heat shock protein transcriptional repressor HspR n=1 Tax=Brevibacterium litoralis TaxID=3138935 RepID=UPI0032F096EE
MDIAPGKAVYVISVAAELAGMHPQTLRQYDRMGLVSPQRTSGRGRRYSAADIERLRLVQRLSKDEGVNLAGIKQILDLRTELEDLRNRAEQLSGQLDSVRARLQQATGGRVFAAGSTGDVVSIVHGQRPEAGRPVPPPRLGLPAPVPGRRAPRAREARNAKGEMVVYRGR